MSMIIGTYLLNITVNSNQFLGKCNEPIYDGEVIANFNDYCKKHGIVFRD